MNNIADVTVSSQAALAEINTITYAAMPEFPEPMPASVDLPPPNCFATTIYFYGPLIYGSLSIVACFSPRL